MKIGTIEKTGVEYVAIGISDSNSSTGERVVALSDVMANAPKSMMKVIEGGADMLGRIEAAAKQSDDRASVQGYRWLPPITRPGKVLCVALNNSANSSRIMKGPSHPAMFFKPSTSLLGHGEPIRLRDDWGRVHPEPELAVVIGRTGQDISHERALDHVFGYTIINDLTAPAMRGEDTFHYRAIHPRNGDSSQVEYVDSWVTYPARYKGSDNFGPIGPWIVTKDDVPDPHVLTISCLHKGELITEDNTSNLTHKVADVIAFASTFMTLEAGDVIAMGTALKASSDGAKPAKAVQNIDLTTLGGPIEVRISGIGSLSNPVERRQVWGIATKGLKIPNQRRGTGNN